MADVCAGSLTAMSVFFLNLEVKAASDDTSSANSFTNEVKEAEACVESTCVRLQRPLTQALRRYSDGPSRTTTMDMMSLPSA